MDNQDRVLTIVKIAIIFATLVVIAAIIAIAYGVS